jgi:hypothetical protein
MKLKVLLGALCWTLFVTLLHVSLNLGWGEVARRVRVLVGEEREELLVGFLPVT